MTQDSQTFMGFPKKRAQQKLFTFRMSLPNWNSVCYCREGRDCDVNDLSHHKTCNLDLCW